MRQTLKEKKVVAEFEPQTDFFGRVVGVFVWLRPGFKFEPEGHCSGFDTLAEARRHVREDVQKCLCQDCQELLAGATS